MTKTKGLNRGHFYIFYNRSEIKFRIKNGRISKKHS